MSANVRYALAAAAAGAASLAVELVWMRVLSLLFGSASLAAGIVVAALMLGMALGSGVASRRPSLRLDAILYGLAGAAALSAPLLRALGSMGGFSTGLGLASVMLVTTDSRTMSHVIRRWENMGWGL